MNVSLGKTDQTYFSVSQFEKVGGAAFIGLVLNCGSSLGCYPEAIAVGPNAEGSPIGDARVLGTGTDPGGTYQLVYRWENSRWVDGHCRCHDRRLSSRRPLGCQPSWEDFDGARGYWPQAMDARHRSGSAPTFLGRSTGISGSSDAMAGI